MLALSTCCGLHLHKAVKTLTLTCPQAHTYRSERQITRNGLSEELLHICLRFENHWASLVSHLFLSVCLSQTVELWRLSTVCHFSHTCPHVRPHHSCIFSVEIQCSFSSYFCSWTSQLEAVITHSHTRWVCQSSLANHAHQHVVWVCIGSSILSLVLQSVQW